MVVNEFEIKYERQEEITHLLDTLKTIYKIFWGLNLEWDYYKREVMVSMSN